MNAETNSSTPSTVLSGELLAPVTESVISNETYVDGQAYHVPMALISARKGFNPRRYFDEAELQQLADSIKVQGVIQPIIIKPNPEQEGHYHLVAGERRFRASTLAQMNTIHAVVRHIDEDVALAMALAENSDRADVSPAEEARACQKMMALCSGDIDEVVLSLGWSKKKVENRLALLHCSESVLDALETRQIKLGIAEVLSQLTDEMQEDSLPDIIANKVSVADLKKSVGRYTYTLSDAAFDTSACAGCPHNSSTTSDLFAETLGDGQCGSRDCYDNKTTQFLADKKASLANEYPVLWMDTEKSDDDRCYLVREGHNGVGREQYSACGGCANFGALMRSSKGNEGHVEAGVCFDTACNKNKVAEYKKEQQQATEAANPTEPANPTATSSTSTTKKPAKKSVAKTPKKVTEYVEERQYKAVKEVVSQDVQMIKIFSVLALSDAIKQGNYTDDTKALLKKLNIEKLTQSGSTDSKVTLLFGVDDEGINSVVRALSSDMAAQNTGTSEGSWNNSIKTAKTVLKLTKTDMAKHFIVDKAFLSNLTISALHSLLKESNFQAWYVEQHSEKDFNANIIKGKHGEQVDNVIKAGFDWSGFVPEVAQIK